MTDDDQMLGLRIKLAEVAARRRKLHSELRAQHAFIAQHKAAQHKAAKPDRIAELYKKITGENPK